MTIAEAATTLAVFIDDRIDADDKSHTDRVKKKYARKCKQRLRLAHPLAETAVLDLEQEIHHLPNRGL